MPASISLEPPAAGVLEGRVGQSMERVLQAVRTHLGMDIAFHSRCHEGAVPFDCRGSDCGMAHATPGVPVRLRDGRLLGALSHLAPGRSLPDSLPEIGLLRTLADLVAHQVDAELEGVREQDAVAARLEAVLAQGQPDFVFQPIYSLGEQIECCGVECLARFRVEPLRGPDQWFADAWSVGRGRSLELAAIRRALAVMATVPGDFYVAVNCSPETVLGEGLEAALSALPPSRLLLEITEHAYVEDYDALVGRLAALRAQGLRIAIDDAGAGYASLHHILSLHPDIIKLDISLIRDIDTHPAKRAMAQALVDFGTQTGCHILAEGVETAGEMEVIRALGVDRVQGYFLSRPLALEALRTLLAV